MLFFFLLRITRNLLEDKLIRMKSFRYFALNKPYGMLSQFSREGNNKSLADLDFKFPPDVYPIGRLDSDSEGLILLSNDPALNHALLAPVKAHWRKYLIQVEGLIEEKDCIRLRDGVQFSINGNSYKSLPCKAEAVEAPFDLPERNPPVRFRKSIPTSWLIMELREGKNRQVRKMTAAVGFPTLRLIRIGIEKLLLDKLGSGEVIEFERADFLKKLNLLK